MLNKLKRSLKNSFNKTKILRHKSMKNKKRRFKKILIILS